MRILKLLPFLPVLMLNAQLARSTAYLARAADSLYAGFIGNSIIDIKGHGDTLWFGTSNGLSATYDNGENFVAFDNAFAKLGYGSVSGLAVSGDHVWVATAYDSTTLTGDYDTGGGISRSLDAGETWVHLGQPMDSLRWTTDAEGDSIAETYSEIYLWGDTLLAVDVVTPINNPSYDLAFDGTRLWTASFAGGLRVSHDLGDTWQRVLLPWDNTSVLDSMTLVDLQDEIEADPLFYALDPVPHRNHRVFSVVAYDDTIWAGTAAGVNHSTDGGLSWQRYGFDNSNVTGNFVVAMHRQITTEGSTLWASTVTTDAQDATGISLFKVNEGYWRATMLGTRPFNFGSSHDAVYAATEYGILKSRDGLHFVPLPAIQNTDGSDALYSDAFFSVFVNSDEALWVGSSDGIAVSRDEGLSWEITKSRPAIESMEFIAFPNPFTPRQDKVFDGQGNVLLRFTANVGDELSITVFDFAMHKVREITFKEQATFSGPQDRTWNGRNDAGYLVANGTYFVRLDLEGETAWTKVMVIN